MISGKDLRGFRLKLDISQDDMALKLKPFLPDRALSKGSVSAWERNIESPSKAVIIAYCKAFKVEESELEMTNKSENPTSESKSPINSIFPKITGRNLSTELWGELFRMLATIHEQNMELSNENQIMKETIISQENKIKELQSK